MLNDLARAQLAGFLGELEADEENTIALSTLKHFIGAEGVAEIKSMNEDMTNAKKDKNFVLSKAAAEYWKRFKKLSRQVQVANGKTGSREREREFQLKSEKLRDDFFRLVPEHEQGKFRIHNGPEDDADWDWRWEGLEGRPPILREELEQGFPVLKPMNYAQAHVISRYLAPQPTEDELAAQRQAFKKVQEKARRLSDGDYRTWRKSEPEEKA